MKLAFALLYAACGGETIVIVPVIDSPTDEDAAVLADLTRIEVTISHAHGGSIVSQSFDRGEPIELAGVPFADDLVIQIVGFVGIAPDPIAIGRSCSFALSPTVQPEPHLFLSRLGKVATLGFKTEVRSNGSALTTADGTALLLGGDNSTTLERFDPRTGKLTLDSFKLEARTQGAIAQLGNVVPKPVIIGGIVDGGGLANSIEVIDFEAHRIDRTGDDNAAISRTGVIATELTDGRILITGGRSLGVPSETIAIVRAKTDGTTVIEKQTETLHRRAGHSATRLGDEDGAPVLIIGGIDDTGALVAQAQLYKPLSDNVPATFAPTMIKPRMNHRAVRLGDNSVLVIGGVDAAGLPVRTLERFSLVDGFTEITNDTLPLAAGVLDFSVTPLPDGRVLLAGGTIPGTAEPVTGVFFATFNADADVVTIDAAADTLSVGRATHTAVLLCDGTVLITGGTGAPSVAERFNANSIQR